VLSRDWCSLSAAQVSRRSATNKNTHEKKKHGKQLDARALRGLGRNWGCGYLEERKIDISDAKILGERKGNYWSAQNRLFP
jgi:hypothetical protein